MNLTEHQAHAVRYCVSETIRRRLLTGAPIPAWLRTLDCNLRSMSAHGPKPAVRQQESEQIDTEEAATILGCSTRHVRRIAADLDGTHIAGRWIFNRHNVTEYRQAKDNHNG